MNIIIKQPHTPLEPDCIGTMSNIGSTNSGGDDRGSGRIATLSNDALYAPLSTFVECTASATTTSTTPSTANAAKNIQQKQQHHSLALQTSSSLRESSLLTFLSSSICTNIKTCHSQEYALYRSLGSDSFSKFGMGDGSHDGAYYSNSIRSLLENKLSNRSLVLVGGGIHTNNNSSAARAGGSACGGGGKQIVMESGGGGLGTTTMTATVTSSISGGSGDCGKRVRKRVGGNGIFGCISNKRRKKLLARRRDTRSDEQPNHPIQAEKHSRGDDELNICNQEKDKQQSTPTSQQPQQQTQQVSAVSKKLVQKKSSYHEVVTQQQSSVIDTLHKMWISYIHQLCHSSFRKDDSLSNPTATTSLLSLDKRKQLSHLLAICEHVGMAVTILQCQSRRHLLLHRCVVVQETKETWSMAMLVSNKGKKKNKKKGDGCSTPKEEIESMSEVAPSHTSSSSSSHKANTSWKVVMLPKRGTVLEVTLPWNGDLLSKDEHEEYVTVRLES